MSFRVSDAPGSNRLIAQIAAQRQRITRAQDQLASGKRINRPSDDPLGAETVIRLKTSQVEIEQFQRNAGLASDALQAADVAVETYQRYLDRAQALLTQGASDTISATAKDVLATELEGLQQQIRNLANTRNHDSYLFGGTRQDVPPFDSSGNPAAAAAGTPLIQIEPQAEPIVIGVTAEEVFADASGNVLAALAGTITALRGTGDAAADKAAILNGLDRLKSLADQAGVARTRVGTGLTHIDAVNARLGDLFLQRQASIERVESADTVESILSLSDAQNALDAILQANNPARRRSLLDLIG